MEKDTQSQLCTHKCMYTHMCIQHSTYIHMYAHTRVHIGTYTFAVEFVLVLPPMLVWTHINGTCPPCFSMVSPCPGQTLIVPAPRVPWEVSLAEHTEFGLWWWLLFLFHILVSFLQIFFWLGSSFLFSEEFYLIQIRHSLFIYPSNEGLHAAVVLWQRWVFVHKFEFGCIFSPLSKHKGSHGWIYQDYADLCKNSPERLLTVSYVLPRQCREFLLLLVFMVVCVKGWGEDWNTWSEMAAGEWKHLVFLINGPDSEKEGNGRDLV